MTSRGGPLVGLEALSLQGLPIDGLLFTRENNDQLQSLAGSAMSSSVIGTCVLAALVIARPDLENVEQVVTAISSSHQENKMKAHGKKSESVMASQALILPVI